MPMIAVVQPVTWATVVAVSGAVDSKQLLRGGLIVGIPSALLVFVFFLVLSTLGLI